MSKAPIHKQLLTLWVVVVTVLSLMPVDVDALALIPHQDKLVHCIFYLVMAFLLGRVIGSDRRKFFLIVLLPGLYGWLMELLQGQIGGGRHFDNFDIIANIIGALIGTVLFYSFGFKNKISNTNP